ncbi:hypothetical protein STVA_28280 [Allostella vacuolata]|nr:hypothetical protein STVA_28280 [Stella vacuolata]
MELTRAPQSWKTEFARRAAWERADRERFHDEQRKKQKQEQEQNRIEEQAELMLLGTVLASETKIETFTVRLDQYDTATVGALMENSRLLEQVRERIDEMLLDAHVLPDGRRVFRTRDGKQVFDEHGQEVDAETVHPDTIDPRRPFWETFKAELDERERLLQERTQLHDYQDRLDQARERVRQGNITERDLDDLGADLDQAMPASVRRALDRQAGKEPAVDRDSPQSSSPSLSEGDIEPVERRASRASLIPPI